MAISAVELLEQRQENAAALKLKSVRVGGMPEGEVAQLRNEIKVPYAILYFIYLFILARGGGGGRFLKQI